MGGKIMSKWNSKIESVAKKAVMKITSQEELGKVATLSKHISVRKIAIENLYNVQLLINIASDGDKSAVSKIAESRLISLIVSEEDSINAISEVKRIAEQSMPLHTLKIALQLLDGVIDDEVFISDLHNRVNVLTRVRENNLSELGFAFLCQAANDSRFSEYIRHEILSSLNRLNADEKLKRIFDCYKRLPGYTFEEKDGIYDFLCGLIEDIELKHKRKGMDRITEYQDETLLGYCFILLAKIIGNLYDMDDFNANKMEYDRVRTELEQYQIIRQNLSQQRSWDKHFNSLQQETLIKDFGVESIEELKSILGNSFRHTEGEKVIAKKIEEHFKALYCYRNFGLMALQGVVNDSERSNLYTNFVKQCVIVGLFEFYHTHKENKSIRKLYEAMGEVMASLTLGDVGHSCFEVRAPYSENFNNNDFAFILSDVLRCMNPEKEYDTIELLNLVEIEAPDIMDMLRKYPLRLIDPEKSMGLSSKALGEYFGDLLSSEENKEGLYKIFGSEMSWAVERLADELFWKEVTQLHNLKDFTRVCTALILYLGMKNMFSGGTSTVDDENGTHEKDVELFKSIENSLNTLMSATKTLGTYSFRPYDLVHWTNYSPPLRKGRVNKRYNVTSDNLRVNGIGVNIKLFDDIPAVVPVLYHEYCHYKGDLNEASVFLRTHIFSMKFYENQGSVSLLDKNFSNLSELLGSDVDYGKFQELNNYILNIYRDKPSKEMLDDKEAELYAENKIANLNSDIDKMNQYETWDSHIKYPRLGLEHGEDSFNYGIIKTILTRYARTPITISELDFVEIVLSETEKEEYFGDLVDGIYHGEGKLVWKNKSQYEGEWVGGNRHGYGILQISNADGVFATYDGHFATNLLHGIGKLQWSNGDWYEGDWIDNERTGYGKFVWANGDAYVGNFVNGVRHGYGEFTQSDGNAITGEWIDGYPLLQMTQEGGRDHEDSTSRWTYIGSSLNGKRHGKGRFERQNGEWYEGDWVNGKKTGHGSFGWPNGDRYEGEWIDDKRTGQGTYTWPNGNVFTGGFLDGKRHGEGEERTLNGATTGVWDNDQYIRGL